MDNPTDLRAAAEADENWFMPTREISHDEAHEIAQRLINSAFDNKDNRARFSIPTRVDHDDDCLIIGFIAQQRQVKASRDALAERVKVLEEVARAAEALKRTAAMEILVNGAGFTRQYLAAETELTNALARTSDGASGG